MAVIAGVLTVLLSLGLIAGSSALLGDRTPGLRVKFITSISLNRGKDYFIDIPRTVTGVRSEGWVPAPREPSPILPGLALYCPNQEYVFCALYDDTGYIAGIQIALDPDAYSDNVLDLSTVGFRRWSPPALAGEAQKTYLINQQFFVNQDVLNRPIDERKALQKDGQVVYNNGLWLPDFDGESLNFFSTNKTKILKEPASLPFTEQACIPLMGQHLFSDLHSDSDCNSKSIMYPWFLLTAGEELVASGFTVFGKMKAPINGKRMWFEIADRNIVQSYAPRAPECFYEYADNPGTVTMRVYYIDKPETALCLGF